MLHDLDNLSIFKDKTLGYEVAYYPAHPNARKGSAVVYLHRLVMENYLGRYLSKDEIVHHKDSNRSNNELSNLELTTQSEHGKHHHPLELSEKSCIVCETIFMPDKKRSKYCSRECYDKDREKIKWPSNEELLEKLKTTSMLQLSKQLGVSDNAIRKRLKSK